MRIRPANRFLPLFLAALGMAYVVCLQLPAFGAAPNAGRYQIEDHGRITTFELAPDEVYVTGRNGRSGLHQVPGQTTFERTQRYAETMSRATGDKVELVLYEAGVPRSDFTRHILTSKILVRLAPGTHPAALAQGLGLVFHGEVRHAPGFFIFETQRPGSSMALAAALRGQPGVLSADPLLTRKQAPRFVPNDTLFPNQWHLRNTGQFGGAAGIDLNVVGVWDTYRGTNVTVAIVDCGVQYRHPDLINNVNPSLQWDWIDQDSDPSPTDLADEFHGTATAGLAAAQGNNALGVSGVAFEATLVGLRLWDGQFTLATDATEADAVLHRNDVISVKSYSWGPPDDGRTLQGPGPLTLAALEQSVLSGRNGLGTIHVWAGGNGLANGDNENYDGYVNSIYTISAAACDDEGTQSWYSEPGACIVVTAPSNGRAGITTTDLVGNDGYSDSNYTSDFGGTSSAAPQVAGVVALMLQANPNLGWRDVQEILMRSATKITADDPDWVDNAAGFHFNHEFGAGLVNASQAVNLARSWVNLGAWTNTVSEQSSLALPIPDNDPTGVSRTFTLTNAYLRVEHVTVTVNISHPYRGNLVITLISPAGTQSRLAEVHSDPNADYPDWKFMSVRNWGEGSQGTWTVQVSDQVAGDIGTLNSVSLQVFGTLAVNPPVVTTSAGTVNYVENAPPIPIDSQLTLFDTNNTILTAARVTIAGGFQVGADVLAFSSQPGITGQYNPSAGILTLSGTTSLVNYQAALQSVTYYNTSDNPTTAPRAIVFTACDGSTTGSATRTLQVTVVNDPPVVADLETAPLSYVDNQPPTPISGTLTVSDVDSTNLAGATVQITSNYIKGEDRLGFSNQNGINGSFDAVSGTLTLSGMASVGAYQTALLSVTYANTNDTPATLTRTVTIAVNDGGSANNLSAPVSRQITVTNANDAPTLNAITNLTILEDAGLQTVSLSGISAGPPDENGQLLTVTASSSKMGLIPNPTVNYTSPNTTGSLSFTPVANANGSATISVVVKDNGGTANGGVDAVTNTFTVTVTAVNDAPTLNAISNVTTNEDAGLQTVNLSGISAGPANERGQTLTVTVSSSNTGLIPNPTVSYTSPSATGSLSFTPVANANGTATISVVVTDSGGRSNGGIDAVTNAFTVTVNAVNDAPTLNAISNVTTNEDAGVVTVNLSGISAGPANESAQALTVTASSSNQGLIPNPTVNYTSPNVTGSLSFTPVANSNGTATITVVVKDDGGTANGGIDAVTNTFTVTVSAVNDAPTLNAISNVTINEDAGLQTVNLSGISAGPANESGQTLTVTVSSSNTGLIPNPTVSYTSPSATGSLSFTPVANANGTATISVVVTDSGGRSNGGIDAVTNTFTVTVNAVNDAPTLNAISNVTTNEDAGVVTVNLSGISAGPANESAQALTVTASSSNQGLIPNPTVNYTSPNVTGSLSFTPVANSNGTATITVVVKDDGGTANGGIDAVTNAFTVTVTAVNDAPSFQKGADVAVAQNSGPFTMNNWATAISPGPGETSQTVQFHVSADKPYLFSAQPAIDASGVLTFAPALNLRGTTVVTVWLQDNGGRANGGMDISPTQTFTITIGLSVDTDHDGMPDDWERAYGLDPNDSSDAALDSDGDGFTNLQEYVAGTSPQDPADAPGITAIEPDGNAIAISFKTVIGKFYRVERSDGPGGGSWSIVSENIAGTGSIVSVSDPDAAALPNCFYRVVNESAAP